jgi:hypothetical protein
MQLCFQSETARKATPPGTALDVGCAAFAVVIRLVQASAPNPSDKIPPAKQLLEKERFSMIQPSNVFKENLVQMPSIDGIARIDLVDGKRRVIASIENKPGKQGSLAVYNYLRQTFGCVDANAAEQGLALFAEHTADARNRPGAHPNVDLLLAIAAGGDALRVDVVPAP